MPSYSAQIAKGRGSITPDAHGLYRLFSFISA